MKYVLLIMLLLPNVLTATEQYDPYECLSDASQIDKEIPVGLATELCSAAWTAEPAKCYAAIYQLDKEIPRGLAVELCAGSDDAVKTLGCYIKSPEWELNRGLAITLCGANKSKN